jgi:hypothetical protein
MPVRARRYSTVTAIGDDETRALELDALVPSEQRVGEHRPQASTASSWLVGPDGEVRRADEVPHVVDSAWQEVAAAEVPHVVDAISIYAVGERSRCTALVEAEIAKGTDAGIPLTSGTMVILHRIAAAIRDGVKP